MKNNKSSVNYSEDRKIFSCAVCGDTNPHELFLIVPLNANGASHYTLCRFCSGLMFDIKQRTDRRNL